MIRDRQRLGSPSPSLTQSPVFIDWHSQRNRILAEAHTLNDSGWRLWV